MHSTLVKMKEYKMSAGKTPRLVNIPRRFLQDHDGDTKVILYRGYVDGHDAIVIKTEK